MNLLLTSTMGENVWPEMSNLTELDGSLAAIKARLGEDKGLEL